MLWAAPARADVTVGYVDWDTYTAGWTNEYGDHTWTSLNVQTNGGNPDGWMEITFPATTSSELLEDEWYDVVHMSASNLFAGPWNPGLTIEFDFWASNTAPHALQVQWKSVGNPNIWSYVLAPPAADTWTVMRAPLSDWQDWQYTGATEDQFLADLSTIDWVGVYIWRESAEEERYGLDNVRLQVPEPAEWIMLAAALGAFSFGRRRFSRRFSSFFRRPSG